MSVFFLTAAKLRKNNVKNNGFWKINAIWPKIKAKRGSTRKYEKEGNAKYGGLVKELGFQIVTSFSHLLNLCDEAVEAPQQFLVGTALY